MKTPNEKSSDAQIPQASEQRQNRDDVLFDQLSKSKKRRKRRILSTVLILLLVAAIVLVAAVVILRQQVRNRFADMEKDVLSHTVQTGTISTLVSGSGVLTTVDAEDITVPSGVELTEILVANGDKVEEGQLLAIADMATVRSAMSNTQDTIEDLDDDIADADDDKASTSVTAGVPGRVKQIWAQVGDPVVDVMVEHGALAVLSLDGYMALDLETDQLKEGDTVTVIRKDAESVTGSVETVVDGVATILLTDNGPRNAEEVTVETEGGTSLGGGKLYIHNPLMITGYAGNIRTVHVKENAAVSKNMYLFTLQDTEYSANYDQLLRDRSDYEETLLELLNIQKAGGITAPIGGTVFNAADLDETEIVTDLLTLSPDKSMSVTISVDESDILSLQPDQQANVTVSSVTEDVLTGIVTEINKTATDGAYTAEITLDRVEGMLPGMTAEIDIKIQGVENAILVPADALHYTSTGAFVYTTYDEELQEYGGRVDVVTGLSNDDYVEIVSGLNLGDIVWYTKEENFFAMFSAMGMGGNRGNQSGTNRRNQPAGYGGAPAMPAGGMSGRN